MKRALAILAVASMFGFAGLAQFSGSWDLTLTVLPSVSVESTFGLEYTYAGWVFSSTSDFDNTGFTSLLFSASGAFGAVSIESEMKFLPQASITWTDYELETPQTPSCPLKKTVWYWDSNAGAWVDTAVTFPVMDYWKTTISLSFAGLEAELLMYQKVFDEFFGESWWYYDVSPLDDGTHPPEYVTTRTKRTVGTYLAFDEYDYDCWSWVNTGTGWRVKIGGELNGVTLTSYTYFNLKETLDTDTDEGCPQLELKGDYEIAKDGECGVGFTSELITFEGFSICCGATLNAALSIGCTGFDYLFVYVEDVPVFPWMNISPWVKFTIDEKQFGFCATPVTAAGCITVSPVFQMAKDETHNDIENTISGIILKEISLTCEFSECSSFSATTVLYDLKSNGLLVIDGPDVPVRFDIWATHDGSSILVGSGVPVVDVTKEPAPAESITTGDEVVGYTTFDYQTSLYVCKPIVKYIAWEKFSFSFCGPGCCGGNYDISIDTYFGKKYTLEWVVKPPFPIEVKVEKEGAEVEPLPGEEIEKQECLKFDYTLATEEELGTLFGWMETDISASVPVSADISLTLDLDLSFQRIEKLGIGFSFQF